MRLNWFIAIVAGGLMGAAASAASAPGRWDQAAASLSEEVAGVLGPGQARLTIRNLSTIPASEIPAIRRLLEQDLKARGVLASGTESANTIRVTLSENLRERLWVAEIAEGTEARVVFVHLDPEVTRSLPAQTGVLLRRTTYLSWFDLSSAPLTASHGPVIAAMEMKTALVVLKQEDIVLFGETPAGWKEQKSFDLGLRRSLPRDPRGILLRSDDGNGFTAFTAGVECSGSHASPAETLTQADGGWLVHCRESDDPWPVPQTGPATGNVALRAFYNSARNYFTGVVTPSLGVDLPPFYAAAMLPRPAAGLALLLGGIDGKVQLAENGALRPVAGTRDWGSEFAVLNSGCGAGIQIIASGSGEAANDSLRAYELPAQDAIPASAPLAMDGSVTALWTSLDGKSIFAVVRNAADKYEVDRVTALCN